MEAENASSGDVQVGKLQDIAKLIDTDAALHSVPVELMSHFGRGGLCSQYTVIACRWFKRWITMWEDCDIACGETFFFKNREVQKHAEMEMLEWLTSLSSGFVAGEELRIAISRSPCQDCLDGIVKWQRTYRNNNNQRVKIRIGFANWYHGGTGRGHCSSASQMSESIDGGDFVYSMLTHDDIESDGDGLFAPLFEPYQARTIFATPFDWKTTMQHAWNDCYEQSKADGKVLHCSHPVHCMFHGDCSKCRMNASIARILNKKSRRINRATRIMLKVFGVHFAFWKWYDATKKKKVQKLLEPRKVSKKASLLDSFASQCAISETKPRTPQ